MENVFEDKQRVIQEYVPGKQTTMAHLIANPKEDLYTKLGVITENRGALGIMTITRVRLPLSALMWRRKRPQWILFLWIVSAVRW